MLYPLFLSGFFCYTNIVGDYMKTNKKTIIWIGLILMLLIGFGIVAFLMTNDEPTNIQMVENSTGAIKEVELPNGVKLTEGKITKNENIYYIEMVATNTLNKEVNMGGYRLSFRDINGNEIEYFSGAVIGNLKELETRAFIIESYADLSKIDRIVYEIFVGE